MCQWVYVRGRRARRILDGGLRVLGVCRSCVGILRLERVQCVMRGCVVRLRDGCIARMFPDGERCQFLLIKGGERKGAFTIVKEGRQAIVKSRWRRCGHAETMERSMEPFSYPCMSRNAMVREESAGNDPSDALTLNCVLSRRIIASGTRSVLSDS